MLEVLAGNRRAALPRHARLLKIVNLLFYYIKNLKSRLYAAKFFKILKFVFLSEVADKSFCVKFSGLISKLKILEKSY